MKKLDLLKNLEDKNFTNSLVNKNGLPNIKTIIELGIKTPNVLTILNRVFAWFLYVDLTTNEVKDSKSLFSFDGKEPSKNEKRKIDILNSPYIKTRRKIDKDYFELEGRVIYIQSQTSKDGMWARVKWNSRKNLTTNKVEKYSELVKNNQDFKDIGWCKISLATSLGEDKKKK